MKKVHSQKEVEKMIGQLIKDYINEDSLEEALISFQVRKY